MAIKKKSDQNGGTGNAARIEDVRGRWGFKTAIVSGVVAVLTSLITLLATSSNLRDASQKLDTSKNEARELTEAARASVPLGTVITSALTPQHFEKYIGHSVQGAPDSSVWVLADGREVRGSDYSELTGNPNVPDLEGYRLQDVDVLSGTIKHQESLVKTLSDTQSQRQWKWIVSLKATDPKTTDTDWEQRVQKLNFSADNPESIAATAQLFNGKHGSWSAETPSIANYLGVSVTHKPVYWYIKINEG